MKYLLAILMFSLTGSAFALPIEKVAPFFASRTGAPVSGLAVDTFQDFHTGNVGDLVTPAMLQASARGDNNWITNKPVATWRVTNAPNFTLRTPISVGGSTITTSGGKAVYFDMTGEDGRPEEEFGFGAPAGIKTMRWGFFGYYNGLNTNNDFSTHDFAQWDDASFFVTFHVQSVSGPSTTQFYSHYAFADGSSSLIPINGSRGNWYWFEGSVSADGSRFLEIYDPNNSYAYVGSEYGYGGAVNSDFTHPGFVANYIPNLGMSGIVAIEPSWVIENPSTNTSPWFPNAPASVSMVQSFDHEVTIRWLEANNGLSPVQASNTTSGVTTTAGGLITGPTWTNMVVTNLSNGSTYSFDVGALYPPSIRRSSVVTVGPVTISEIDVTNGLQGEWRMNGNYNDSSFRGNNALGGGTTAPGFDNGVSGTQNHSLLLDGNDQYLLIGNAGSAGLNLQAPLTLMAWVKCQVPVAGNYADTIYGSHGSGTATPHFYAIPGDHYYLTSQFTAAIGQSTSVVPTNTWQHVAFTYDVSGNWVCYVNGSASGSGTSLQTFSYVDGQFLQIGWGTWDGGSVNSQFNGNIEDFRIYNRALSSSEITTVYSMGGQ